MNKTIFIAFALLLLADVLNAELTCRKLFRDDKKVHTNVTVDCMGEDSTCIRIQGTNLTLGDGSKCWLSLFL